MSTNEWCLLILGPFLLTNLLLDDITTTAKITGDARIVMVSAGLHDHIKYAKSMSGLFSFCVCVLILTLFFYTI